MTGNEPNTPATPPADSAGGQPAQPPAAEPGKTLTQAEVDAIVKARLARDREALEKDLGMSLKDAKILAAAKKKADDDAKSEVDRLKGEVDTHKTDAQQARLEAAKLRALVKAGVPADKVDALLKRVVGSTPEEIEADVLDLAGLGLLAAKTPIGAQGAGNPGLPNPPKEPTLLDELEKEQAKGAGADAVKLIQLRSLIAAGAKS